MKRPHVSGVDLVGARIRAYWVPLPEEKDEGWSEGWFSGTVLEYDAEEDEVRLMLWVLCYKNGCLVQNFLRLQRRELLMGRFRHL